MAKKSRRIKLDQLADTIHEILDEYETEGNDRFAKGIKSMANKAKQAVRDAAPKKTGAYAGSLAVKTEFSTRVIHATVYAKAPHYRLTHLLEHGHALVYFGHPTGRRVQGFEHWGKGQELVDGLWVQVVDEAWSGRD